MIVASKEIHRVTEGNCSVASAWSWRDSEVELEIVVFLKAEEPSFPREIEAVRTDLHKATKDEPQLPALLVGVPSWQQGHGVEHAGTW